MLIRAGLRGGGRGPGGGQGAQVPRIEGPPQKKKKETAKCRNPTKPDETRKNPTKPVETCRNLSKPVETCRNPMKKLICVFQSGTGGLLPPSKLMFWQIWAKITKIFVQKLVKLSYFSSSCC